MNYSDLTEEERETYARYWSKGYKQKRILRVVEDRRIREYVKKISPEKLAELGAKVKANEERVKRVVEEEEREWQAGLYARREEFRTALVNAVLPDFGFLDGVYGLLAQRAWSVTREGGLQSTVRRSIWNGVMFADVPPSEHNEHGLYCNAINPLGLMLWHFRYLLALNAQGIIECRGRVVCHSDGVVRAEWARILCLIIIGDDESVYDFRFVRMRERYFPIPVYVMTGSQYAEFLFRLLTFVRFGSERG